MLLQQHRPFFVFFISVGFLVASLASSGVHSILLQRDPGSPNLLHVRLSVPNPSQGIAFRALLPQSQCLTEDANDNRLFLDLPGCRLSLDWSSTLFGTTRYYRKGARPRVRRKWRTPVQKLKFGSAVSHLGNDMSVQMNDSGLTTASVRADGILMGAQQTKALNCPLGLSQGGLLDMKVFSPPGMAKCQIAVEFDDSYKMQSSEEKPFSAQADGRDFADIVLEQEAMRPGEE